MNEDFVNFLSFLLSLDENEQLEEQRLLRGEGSLQELVEDFQLTVLHGIDLQDVLKLLREYCGATLREKENYVQYWTQEIKRLSIK